MGVCKFYECDVCGQRREMTTEKLGDILDAGWRILEIKWGAVWEAYTVCPECSDFAVHLPRPVRGFRGAMRPLKPALSKLEAKQ